MLSLSEIFTLECLPYSQWNSLPKITGLYFVVENSNLLYVGKSLNIRFRWSMHNNNNFPQHIASKYPNAFIHWYLFENIKALSKLEKTLIKQFQPPLNKQGVSSNLGAWNLSKVMNEKGIDENELAIRLAVHPSKIITYKDSENWHFFRIGFLLKLCEVLDCQMTDLIK